MLGWEQAHFRVAPDGSDSVETADGRQVVSVESDNETGARVSAGVARGARVQSRHARSATDPAPLTSNEFKARVRALLGEIGALGRRRALFCAGEALAVGRAHAAVFAPLKGPLKPLRRLRALARQVGEIVPGVLVWNQANEATQ